MNILTPIDWSTGYGITGYNIWKKIYEKDNTTALFPIGSGNAEINWKQDDINHSINNRLNSITNVSCFKLWYLEDFFLNTHNASKYGGMSFFEIDKLTDIQKKSLSILDTVFVASNWAKQVLIENGIKKDIIVAPLGVDTSIFNSKLPEDKDYNKYIFINIGKWEIRKGHDVLVDIFNDAFTEKDNVELWMLNTNHFLNEEQTKYWYLKYKNSKLSEKIKFFPKLPTQDLLAKVMAFADCGIYPSRGEGWNNEAIETMAMNKPLIITNYSAHTEYCNAKNSFLIDIDDKEKAQDNIFFDGFGRWANIGDKQKEQTIEHMRYVYDNNIRENLSGLETAKFYSWENTANIIYTELCKI